MKYICLGYIEEGKWEGMSESERSAMIDECFTYDDELRKNGHFAGGEALQGPQNAVTLRFQNGKVSVTDGPFAETKEQLGGILVLEANDLNHAIQLMSKHPGVKAGPFEIRPAADLNEMIRESERRRSARTKPCARRKQRPSWTRYSPNTRRLPTTSRETATLSAVTRFSPPTPRQRFACGTAKCRRSTDPLLKPGNSSPGFT